MGKQKGQALIFLLVGIVVITVIGGTLYLGKKYTAVPQSPLTPNEAASPAQDSIGANWKTYTNGKYGFEFKYPKEYSFKKTEPVTNDFDSTKVITDLELYTKQSNETDLLINITSEETLKEGGGNFPVLSTAQWIEEKQLATNNPVDSDCSFLLASKFDDRQNECKITEISGLKMLDRIMFWPPGAATGRSFTFYNGNYRYDFTIFSYELYNFELNRLLTIKESNNLPNFSLTKLNLQILQTFKFTQ